ncbi:polyprenyl synthetase family protein [Aquella oligotrophica]|uniref:Octaprenyl diphosphate synthase n=1 Tax=Aquella oligotrophica TaxID=2067065 RepID=A0A2I7N3K3_9NEIS|nr:polyprenyl synthetase family protein [Aquella oligotrophica]AUR51041.1 octaprenyl diphosphate synthase [Aquella oligotrophica]
MFEELVKSELEFVDKVIRKDLGSQVPLINTVGEYIISAGGKRIRPLLTVMCGRMLGNSSELIYKMAAMIEYIHTATLLHDDVVDESGLRRGRATANAMFGNAASVLVGDFIYTRAFQLMVESNSLKVLKIMADSTNVISEGEVLQLLNIGRSDLTEVEYFKVIESKTARLFEAGARVAAIVSGATVDIEDKLADYAICLGTAFQIVDDILDYNSSSEVMGKNVGDDLLEGKVTLPLIFLLATGDANTKSLITAAIDKPKEADIAKIVNLVLDSNSLDYCRKLAHDYVLKAKDALKDLPDNNYRDVLFHIAELSIERIK